MSGGGSNGGRWFAVEDVAVCSRGRNLAVYAFEARGGRCPKGAFENEPQRRLSSWVNAVDSPDAGRG